MVSILMMLIFSLIFMIILVFLYFGVVLEKIVVIEILLLQVESAEFKFLIYFDNISLLFMLVVKFISCMVFLYSRSYMEADKMKIKFFILTMMFVFSMDLVIMSMNMVMIILGWDGLGVVSYLLVIFYQNDLSNYSGFTTIITNRLGDVSLMISIYFVMNDYLMDIFIFNLKLINKVFIIMVAVSMFTKSAQYPFSVWLPLAMAAPTPISSLVHSSTLVTAGVYLLIRVSIVKMNQDFIIELMLVMCLLTMFISSTCAYMEMDMKKIIAYSTMSQLSLMFISVFIGDELMGFYHILTHALFKSLLFLCSGVFIHENLDNQDVRSFSFMLKVDYLTMSFFMVCSLSLMGFPFLSGFYSKDLILEYIYTSSGNKFMMMVIFYSTIFTSIYSLRVMIYGLVKGKKISVLNSFFNWDCMHLSMILIFMMSVMFGSILNWMFFSQFKILVMFLEVKLMSVGMIISGMLIFVLLNLKNYKSNMVKEFFYLKSFQGIMISMFQEKFIFYSTYSEYYWYLYFNKDFEIVKFVYFFSFMKFIYFQTFILMFFWLMFVIY